MKLHSVSHKSVDSMLLLTVLLSLALMTGNSIAEESAVPAPKPGAGKNMPKPAHHEMSLEEMSKKLDNPLSDLWMVWMQNDNFHYNGDISSEDRTLNVSYFEPVISIPISDEWNLVNRPVLTRINADVPDIDLGSLKGHLGGLPRGLAPPKPGSGEFPTSC